MDYIEQIHELLVAIERLLTHNMVKKWNGIWSEGFAVIVIREVIGKRKYNRNMNPAPETDQCAQKILKKYSRN